MTDPKEIQSGNDKRCTHPGNNYQNMTSFINGWDLPSGECKGQIKPIPPKNNIILYYDYGSFTMYGGPPEKGKSLEEQTLMVPTQLIDDNFNINFDYSDKK
jgi:hypothetical protein